MDLRFEVKHFVELSNAELYEILKLRSEVFVVEQACIFLDLDDKDQNAYHVIGRDGSTVVATTRLFGRGQKYDDYHCIGRVCSSSKCRGQGTLCRKIFLKYLPIITSLKVLGEG